MPGKDPNPRKSRSGSRVRVKRVGSRPKSSRSPSSSRASSRPHTAPRGEAFVLYVEGARDREILECWARRVDPRLARCIERNTVILGGRRPARAVTDFQNRGGSAAGYSGLIVLDGDDLPVRRSFDANSSSTGIASPSANSQFLRRERGLEVFVWSLRHIESYLLVPAAIRRLLRLEAGDRRVERFIEIHSSQAGPESGGDASNGIDVFKDHSVSTLATRGSGSLHAKRVLGAGGSLSEALGSELRAGDIARAMRVEDLHQDVLALFMRMSALSGLAVEAPEVVIRPS